MNNNVQEKLADKVMDTKEELTNDLEHTKQKLYKSFFEKMEIPTPSAVCTVRGTEFAIQVDEFDNTEVNVKKGIVDLTGNLIQGTIILRAGSKGIVKGTGEILGPLKIDEKQFDNWDQN